MTRFRVGDFVKIKCQGLSLTSIDSSLDPQLNSRSSILTGIESRLSTYFCTVLQETVGAGSEPARVIAFVATTMTELCPREWD